MDMLNSAVNALKNGHEPTLGELTLNECDIDMHLPAFLPDDYIRDVNTRLSLYKRIASCQSPDEFADLKIELIDPVLSYVHVYKILFSLKCGTDTVPVPKVRKFTYYGTKIKIKVGTAQGHASSSDRPPSHDRPAEDTPSVHS